MSIPSLSSTVLAALPSRQQLTEPKNLALGGLAVTSIAAGGIIGKLRGHPLIGAGIGAAVAAVALGAALLGNASESYYDYPSGGGRNYPSGGGRHTSPGDDGGYRPGSGGGHTSPGDSGGYTPPSSGGSHSSGNSTDNGNPSESDF
jgi:hypothetical protein